MLTVEHLNGTPVTGVPDVADTVTVINPALIPAGAELFIFYFNSGNAHAGSAGLAASLIDTSSYTCRNATQPPANP